MWKFLYEVLINGIRKFFENAFAQIAEINQKYAVPQLKSTKWTRLALLLLQIYLVALLLILFYKFFTLLK